MISMPEYNAAFFGLYENTFLTLKEERGEEEALRFLTAVISRGLKTAYDKAGFQKGSTRDFARVVGERDESVGLRVEFPRVEEGLLIYQFHTDPFPDLRGHVEPEKLDRTYMDFKVNYLLGEGWSYETPRHLWRGDKFTEHVIRRKVA